MDEASLALFGAIVSHNVDQLALTNEAIRKSDEREKQRLALTVHKLASAIEQIPRMMRTVYLDETLWSCQVGIDHARSLLPEGEEW